MLIFKNITINNNYAVLLLHTVIFVKQAIFVERKRAQQRRNWVAFKTKSVLFMTYDALISSFVRCLYINQVCY